jgi:hypothetical protein
LALVSGGLIWAYANALRAPAAGTFHDDGIYAVTAQALATGHGYRIVSLPSEMLQTKYPFLFPALLAAVWWIFPRFPQNLIWLKLVPLGCALAWAGFSYCLLREKTDRAASLALTGLMALSPWVLFLGTALLSETLFALFVTGALVLAGRMERGRRGWGIVAGAAILAGAAFLTRTAGIAVIGACATALLVRGRPRRAIAFVLICAALCAPWICWQLRQAGSASSYDAYYSQANYGDWNILSHFTPAQKASILAQNLLGVLLAPAVLMGVPATGWGAGGAILAGLLVGTGFVRRLSWRPEATEILVLLYSGLVVCWAWPPVRFLAPLLPLLLLYGYEGGQALCRTMRVPARHAAVALAAVGLLCATQGAWTLEAMVAAVRETGAVPVPNTPQDDWREMSAQLAWLTRNTSPHAVLMGNLDPALYLYTGRKSVRGFVQDPYQLHYAAGAGPLGSAGDMLRAAERYGVSYLVATPNLSFREGVFLEKLALELTRANPGSFHLAYQSRDSRYRIYAITSDRSTAFLSPKPNFPPHRPMLGSDYKSSRVNGREKKREETHETYH